MKISSSSTGLVKSLQCERSYHSKEAQDDEYDGNYDQSVDPTAGLWEARAYVPTEKAECPQNYQNYDDNPE